MNSDLEKYELGGSESDSGTVVGGRGSSSRVAFYISVLLNIVLIGTLGAFLVSKETILPAMEAEMIPGGNPVQQLTEDTRVDKESNSGATRPLLRDGPNTHNEANRRTKIIWRNHTDKVYGLVHMAKTAGTEINGELAVRYERVCGNKGYSYDSYAFNDRMEAWREEHPGKLLMDSGGYPDFVSAVQGKGFDRGRMKQEIMDEIGYEDCDYVSQEVTNTFWGTLAVKIHPVPLEVHVPCREPIEHLLSMCNMYGKKFECAKAETSVEDETRKCLINMNRFNDANFRGWQKGPAINITTKCFNPIPIDNYVKYMGSILQPKRLQRSYVHRATNRPRIKEEECLLKNQPLQQKVKEFLVQNVPIFRFCHGCVGSSDDLLASNNQEEYYKV
jgi:hypothetical protein